MKKLLVIRFSALGDVAMCVPAVQSILDTHQDVEITFLSRGFAKSLFNDHERLKHFSADLNGKHKGLLGLRKLAKQVKTENFDYILDLHDVLRSRIIQKFFPSKIKRFKIDKDRKTKKAIVEKSLPLKKLKHSSERYLDVFRSAGFHAEINPGPWKRTSESNGTSDLIESKSEFKNIIGIAPYAAHENKVWGHDKIVEIIKKAQEENVGIFLFGGGPLEQKQLGHIDSEYENCTSLVGKFSLEEELHLMTQVKCMITMDSGNMHMACNVGSKVISVWGPTHHYLGFGPLGNEDHIVEIDTETLPDRPCSIYGPTKTIYQNACAMASMDLIEPEMVWNKIEKFLD